MPCCNAFSQLHCISKALVTKCFKCIVSLQGFLQHSNGEVKYVVILHSCVCHITVMLVVKSIVWHAASCKAAYGLRACPKLS